MGIITVMEDTVMDMTLPLMVRKHIAGFAATVVETTTVSTMLGARAVAITGGKHVA